MSQLREKITSAKARIGVVGLGYVGLPLAIEFAAKGYSTLGIDLDSVKIEKLNAGTNYIEDIPEARFHEVFRSGRFQATTSYEKVGECDAIYICVPTPFTDNKEPDVSFIVDAAKSIATCLRNDQLVVLKSTTFPETTEKVVMPILEATGLNVGKDFFLAFSPERIDPGNKKYTTANTPTIVGGVTEVCTDLAVLLNSQIISQVVRVSNPRVAEMAKLLENIFRSVNIALVNELAMLCDRMGNINIWEVIQAAATKPFGYMPFYPGPGIGGHCILIDPYYLSWKARGYDFHTNFIELAAEVNEDMPYYVYGQIVEALARVGVPLSQAKVLVLGAAFKKDVDDIRHSPSLKVMEIMMQNGIEKIAYNDPFVPTVQILGTQFESTPLDKVSEFDLIFVGTDHSQYDMERIVSQSRQIVDARNVTRNAAASHRHKIRILGGGR